MSAVHSLTSDASLEVRPAADADYEKISHLIYLESQVHRHLDWRAPLDWLGRTPYLVIQEGERLSAVLACPPDPDSIAWIRLFACASHISVRAAWQLLWPAARQQLAEQGGGTVAAIATQRWFEPVLIEGGFELGTHIVMLEWKNGPSLHAVNPAATRIRPMTPEDLPRVADVDAAAFELLWRNSLEALTHAHAQASYASIAEDGTGILAYQLSTSGAFGTHLARLAVLPQAQRRGLAAALVTDLIQHMPSGTDPRLTVNTQANNSASLALYERLGFRRTGEQYPVLAIQVH
jgi:ribosomal-protein-alanine N-acetyltransferase